MNSLLSVKQPAFRLAARWTGAAAITLGALFAASTAVAAPAAGTVIGNQASASYLDPNGNVQLATSNLVQTTVQQVGSYTLDANGAKTAGAGATVYVPHTLTNTGNGADNFNITVSEATGGADFSKIEVFADADGNGLPDSTTALCSITTPGATCTVAPTQSVPGSNGVFKFVVAYSIPSTAVMGTWPSNTATVTATVVPSSVTYAAAGPFTNTDTVTLTDQAAFAVTKSISQPTVGAGTVAWPSAASSGPRGTSTLYTFNYSNNGGAAGTFVLSDTLPAGMVYTASSAVWSNAPGTSLTDASGSETVAGIEYEAVSNVIKVRIANVNPNVSGSLSFVVSVTGTAAIGTAGTSNTATYSPVTCAAATIALSTSCTTASTNTSVFTVTANYGVTFGVSPTPLVDTTANSGVPATTGDTVTMPSVVPGGSVKFTQVVSNTGNASDTFNLSTTGVGTAGAVFPTGTTFTWFASDGVTPLLDTTSDGISDTGPIAAGATRTVVLQVTVPGSTVVGSGIRSVVARATSAADATKFDAVEDDVTQVIGSLVDLTNTATGNSGTVGEAGPGPGTAAVITVNVATGAVASVPLYIKNNDSIANTYNVRVSQSSTFPGSLPAGYTVTYSSTVCSAPTAMTLPTGSVAATTGQALVYACVTVPASAAAGTQAVYFQVTSAANGSTGATVTDAIYDALNISIAATKQFTVSPSNAGQAPIGGTVVYAHTITNTGNQSCGQFNIAAAPTSAGASAGWTTAIYVDVNGNGVIDSGDTLVTSGTVPAIAGGATEKILVRVFVPGGVTVGAQEIVTLTTSDPTLACVLSGSNPIDTTTVITGQVRVVKSQAADTGCAGTTTTFVGTSLALSPGQCVVYEVVATNEGSSNVSNIAINDAIPPNTVYAGATQPITGCAASGVTGTAPVYATSGTTVNTVSCGSTSNVIAPGGTLTLKFAVKIPL